MDKNQKQKFDKKNTNMKYLKVKKLIDALKNLFSILSHKGISSLLLTLFLLFFIASFHIQLIIACKLILI